VTRKPAATCANRFESILRLLRERYVEMEKATCTYASGHRT
jgi:hypothetical protein